MKGRRLRDGEFLAQSRNGDIRPGDYGAEVMTAADDGGEIRDWFVCCPDGSLVRLWVNDDDSNGNRHLVTEHEDGTISVGGSIMGHDVPAERIGGAGPITSGTWHGWLVHGEWRTSPTSPSEGSDDA